MDRLDAIRAAAAAYSVQPGLGVHRIRWRDISADIFRAGNEFAVAVKGTDPEKIANLIRDADIIDTTCRDHPQLGECFAGALNAAEGLLPLILAIVGDAPIHAIGHSLGGQIAVDVGALLTAAGHPVAAVWGFDPPKSGGPAVTAVLAQVPVEILKFSGSIVSEWPFGRGQHVRPPITVGDWTPDLLTAHSIQRASDWVAAHEAVPA